jgi:hypothetical protein
VFKTIGRFLLPSLKKAVKASAPYAREFLKSAASDIIKGEKGFGEALKSRGIEQIKKAEEKLLSKQSGSGLRSFQSIEKSLGDRMALGRRRSTTTTSTTRRVKRRKTRKPKAVSAVRGTRKKVQRKRNKRKRILHSKSIFN